MASKALRKKRNFLKTIKVGYSVEYEKKGGIARFVGLVHFRSGIWVGIELYQKQGLHDGTVKGKRYFHSKPGHGVLVPAAKIIVTKKQAHQ